MSDNLPFRSQFLVYAGEDGVSRLELRMEDDIVWLNQQQLAELFQTRQQNISLHLNNIFEERELLPEATVKEYLSVQTEGGARAKSFIRAKNYRNEEELRELNNLIEYYLIFADGQAMRRVAMHMTDWITKLDGFLGADTVLHPADVVRERDGLNEGVAAHPPIRSELCQNTRGQPQ